MTMLQFDVAPEASIGACLSGCLQVIEQLLAQEKLVEQPKAATLEEGNTKLKTQVAKSG